MKDIGSDIINAVDCEVMKVISSVQFRKNIL